ncbi:hypothetical protein CH25_gp45 [Mycobacterium phage EagleEye]|uniref:Uncharacterized protein n=1 Tax=Mycobacterium phage EagleEye TaxID=1429759 RepID=W0LJ76_9CAUD|nr:hypothetical protein CH25_gp45 [Mycobacterium phage EagleEye]AHG23841.1 hypothetical protein PBI_EAGLEEYE_61 [Mycobacterium phage EagleEye]
MYELEDAYKLEKDTFETWEEVPEHAMVKSSEGIFVKLNDEVTAFTNDVKSLGGWSGGWISIATGRGYLTRGPYTTVTVSS